MTNPTQKTPRFGTNKTTTPPPANPDDDLILADLQTTTDDSQLKIIPLRHWQDDEDEIEQILAHTGIQESAQTHAEPNWTASQSEFLSPMVEIALTDATDIQQPTEATQTNTRIEPRLDAIEAFIDAPSPKLTIPTPQPNPETEKTELFEISPFINSYLTARTALPATQEPQPQPTPDIAQTPAPAETTDTLTAPLQPTPQVKPLKDEQTNPFEKPTYPNETEQNQQTEKTAPTRPQPVITQKAQLPIWQVMLLLTILSLLLITTYQLTTTLITLKSDIARISALLEVVKDDVEALNQK